MFRVPTQANAYHLALQMLGFLQRGLVLLQCSRGGQEYMTLVQQLGALKKCSQTYTHKGAASHVPGTAPVPHRWRAVLETQIQ